MAIVPRWLAQSDGFDICDFGSGSVNALIELGASWCWEGERGGGQPA